MAMMVRSSRFKNKTATPFSVHPAPFEPVFSFAGMTQYQQCRAAIDAYDDYLIPALNARLASYGFTDELEMPRGANLDSKLMAAMCWLMTNEGMTAQEAIADLGGMVHGNQVTDGIGLFVTMIGDETTGCSGDTQTSKTSAAISAMAFTLLHRDHIGAEKELAVLVSTNSLRGDSQNRTDKEGFCLVHGPLRFKGQYSTLDTLVNHEKLFECIKRDGRKQHTTVTRWAARAGCKRAILAFDEADAGSANDSIMADWCRELSSPQSTVRARRLYFSGTSYPFEGVYPTYRMIPGTGYSGTTGRNLTAVADFSDLGQVLNIPSLASFSMKAFKEASKVAAAKMSTFVGEAIFKLFGSPPMSAAAKAIGLNGNSFNGGTCVALRGGTGVAADRMADNLEAQLRKKGIKLIRFTGATMRERVETWAVEEDGRRRTRAITVRDIVLRNNGAPLVLYIKNVGRRQDRFPAECAMIFDMTDNFSTTIAMEQGSLGRLSGYGKMTLSRQPIVFVSERNKTFISDFRQSTLKEGRKSPNVRVGSQTQIVDELGQRLYHGRVSHHVRVPFSRFGLVHIGNELTRMLGQFIQLNPNGIHKDGYQKYKAVLKSPNQLPNPRLYKRGRTWVAQSNKYMFETRIIEDYFPEIEDALRRHGVNVSLLPFGQVSPHHGDSYQCVGNYTSVHPRNTDTRRMDKGSNMRAQMNGKSSGVSTSAQKGRDEIVLNVDFDPVTHAPTVVGVVLLTVEPFKERKARSNTPPQGKTRYEPDEDSHFRADLDARNGVFTSPVVVPKRQAASGRRNVAQTASATGFNPSQTAEGRKAKGK